MKQAFVCTLLLLITLNEVGQEKENQALVVIADNKSCTY